MKTQSEKLLIIIGRMPVVLKVRMNIFGPWLLNSFLIATALAAILPRSLLLLRNLLKQPLKNLSNSDC